MAMRNKRTDGRVIVNTSNNEEMIDLDFGEDSTVEIVNGRVVVRTTPEKAMSFISDQDVRDAIRIKSNLVHRKRLLNGKEARNGVIRPTALV